jgi:hypothetical protein
MSTGQPLPEAESLRSRPRDSEAVPARGGGAPREVKKAESLRSRPRDSEVRAGERGWGPANINKKSGPARIKE